MTRPMKGEGIKDLSRLRALWRFFMAGQYKAKANCPEIFAEYFAISEQYFANATPFNANNIFNALADLVRKYKTVRFVFASIVKLFTIKCKGCSAWLE